MRKILIKNKKGFALIFTLMIVSIISVISAGLLSASYKQMILSSLARDSEIAFYQSDTATDCAMYADLVASSSGGDPEVSIFDKPGTWTCGESIFNITPLGDHSYNLSIPDEVAKTTNPCFDISVRKIPTGIAGVYDTNIKSRGYNVCNKENPRAVEREIEVNY